MTSVVDKYYRRIIQNIDNVGMKFDISTLLVKSKKHDSKINDIENDISDNLELINTNKSNISDNLELINTNKSNISDNLELINTNKSNIFDNLTKIGANETNISSNLEKINSIEENNLKISNNVFNDKYDIEKQSFNFNKNSHSYILFQKIFEYDFNTDGELIINNIINYKYDNLKNDINRLTHLYEFYNNNILFYSITLDNHDFGITSNSDKNILNIDDNFCFNINNKNNIKLVLTLTRINQWGSGNIKLKMIDDNNINITYKVKTDISNKFDENDRKIKVLDEKVSVNNTLIGNNFNSLLPLKSNYIINNMWLFNLGNKDVNFMYNIQKFLVYENDIVYNFKIGSFIELNESCLYLFDSLKNYYFILKETYQFLDQNDTLIEEFSFNVVNKGAVFRNYQIYKNTHYHKVISNITNLKLRLYLERINNSENNIEFKLKLTNDFQSNFICLKYFEYTSKNTFSKNNSIFSKIV